MASEGKKATRSESLTIRLNPRTRFLLEFVSRIRGQTITTVVERALTEAGDHTAIRQEYGSDSTWKEYWDVSEGIRALKVAAEPELFPTYEEERRLHFARQFWEYFYKDAKFQEFNRVYIDILWPRIDDFISHHEETKSERYYSVETEMRNAIRAARVTLPKSRSGVGTNEKPDTKPTYDLDDDIPF